MFTLEAAGAKRQRYGPQGIDEYRPNALAKWCKHTMGRIAVEGNQIQCHKGCFVFVWPHQTLLTEGRYLNENSQAI